jgi:hypothetical protein
MAHSSNALHESLVSRENLVITKQSGMLQIQLTLHVCREAPPHPPPPPPPRRWGGVGGWGGSGPMAR